MTATDRVLDHLDAVRQTGEGTWIARCPAHDDRTPSLSVREVSDRVLVHCFAGCGATEVMAALGLALADLFEQPLGDHLPPSRHRIPAADRLALVNHEALIVAVAASQVARGNPLSDDDRDRVLLAAHRIGVARDVRS